MYSSPDNLNQCIQLFFLSACSTLLLYIQRISKNDGGLGFRNLHAFNLAMLGKQG